MACRMGGAKPLSEPILEELLTGPLGTNFSDILVGNHTFSFSKKKNTWKCRLRYSDYFVSASMS